MKQALLFLFCIVFFAAYCKANTTISSATNTADLQATFAFDWRFKLGADIEGELAFDDTSWQQVQIPHDWSIEGPANHSPFSIDSPDAYDTGYAKTGLAWYRKTFYPPTSLANKHLMLEFGGIYLNSKVYLNGRLIGGQHNGYTSFVVDLSPHLKLGAKNLLAVQVNNNGQNSRWYSGSGIYRPITLFIKNPIDFKHWGTSVFSKVAGNAANIAVNTVINNTVKRRQNVTLTFELLDEFGKKVAISKVNTTLKPGENTLKNHLKLQAPQLWSPKLPYLYQLKQTIVTDSYTSENNTKIGIRTLTLDSKQGLLINGQKILLQGMNMHHDNYMLGAAAYPRAEERKVAIIVDAGYNAVRTSHNPPSQAFLHAADKLGLLVINEAFDSWNQKKWDHSNDYSSRFQQDWPRDLSHFVARDVNHPSVIMWSLGNEIPEQGSKLGKQTAAQLVSFVRNLDPSRPITIGANISGKLADEFLNTFDVTGYNYQAFNYVQDRKRNPMRLMYGSESYPKEAFTYWQYVKQHPFVIGDFVWTGWDYLGEAGIGWTGYQAEWKGIAPYPWHLAFCGEIDVLGQKKPAAFYRDVLWKTGNNRLNLFVTSPTPSYQPAAKEDWLLHWTTPDIHPSWTWPGHENQPMSIVVYSDYDRVDLYLNENKIASQKVSEASEWKALFSDVIYKPGTLSAKGYSYQGGQAKLMETTSLTTSQKPASILLTADRSALHADGQDLIYLKAQLIDENGRPIYYSGYDLTLGFSLSGPGDIVGLGAGNPTSTESFQGLKRSTHNGKLIAVLRSRYQQAGTITVAAKSKDLASNKITIRSE